MAFSSKGTRAAPVQPGAQPWSGACVRPGVCECLPLRAGVPKFRRQPVYVGPVLVWQTPVRRDFPWGPGDCKEAASLGSAMGSGRTDRSTGLPGATGGGRAWGSMDAVRFFPELMGTWSSVFRASGWQAAGLDMARACLLLEPALEALEGSPSSWALPSPPASRLPVPPPVGAQMVAWCRDSKCL